jgi:N-acetylglutamate synthase-like GNAT family acetyltransferase
MESTAGHDARGQGERWEVNAAPGKLRLAREADIPALEELIPLSVRGLQSEHYSPAQIDAALGPIFGVDRQLIRDGTYFVVETEGRIVGCGGWSKRKKLFGGDEHRTAGEDELLDPACDAARIRAFFVHPDFARRGIGREILKACEAALVAAGYRKAELSATLAGEPLYAAFGFQVVERYEFTMAGGLGLPVVLMKKGF